MAGGSDAEASWHKSWFGAADEPPGAGAAAAGTAARDGSPAPKAGQVGEQLMLSGTSASS